jgi:predicted Rossmann fold flavoprotein
VKISGGGRCNVTHAIFDVPEMSTRYPRGQNFVKKAFHRFFTTDTIQWFEQRGVKLKTEKDGRMFPVTDSSQTIIDCLMGEAAMHGVEIRTLSDVRILKKEENEKFLVLFSDLRHPASGPQSLSSDFVCLATGGYPKASMFEWLKSTGHSFAPPVPSLFTFNLPRHPLTALMGVSVEKARVKIEGTKLVEEGPVLVTHWGLSGPAVLRLSAWGARELALQNYQFKIHINWLPDKREEDLRDAFQELRTTNASKKLSNHHFGLPARLWQFLLHQSGVKEDLRFADLPAKSQNSLVKNLTDYVLEVNGKTTFKEEFVTAGGINLSEVDVNTMMSKKISNLFFAGEVLDVDGITGGFNFQHAWTSGWVAARSIGVLAGD